MSPTLLFNALFVSYAVVFFNGVSALPNPAVTVIAKAAAANTAKAVVASSSTTPTTTIAAASSPTVVATSSAAAAMSTSTAISPLGSSTDVFIQGKVCKASWIPAISTSTTWKNMSIELMTGSNLQMTKLAMVASGIDGTSATTTEYDFACPDVSPNAPIYFLQYTHDDNLDPMWTTRFTIAATDGIWDPAPEANQPEGGSPAIPWGQGQLVVTTATFNSASSQVKTSASGVSSGSSSSSSSSGSSDSTGNSDTSDSSSTSSSVTLSQQSGSPASFQRPAFSAIALALAVALFL